jgi:hypothetical protein
MYRADHVSASTVLPPPTPPVTEPGGRYFQPGNPAGGTLATVLQAEWLNMVQEEISNVVLDAGLVLDKANRNQLSQAISSLTGQYLPLAGGLMSGTIQFNLGLAPPVVGAISLGTRLRLFPNTGADSDIAIGVTGGAMWFGVRGAADQFHWYGGADPIATLTGAGNLVTDGTVTSNPAGRFVAIGGGNPGLTMNNSGAGSDPSFAISVGGAPSFLHLGLADPATHLPTVQFVRLDGAGNLAMLAGDVTFNGATANILAVNNQAITIAGAGGGPAGSISLNSAATIVLSGAAGIDLRGDVYGTQCQGPLYCNSDLILNHGTITRVGNASITFEQAAAGGALSLVQMLTDSFQISCDGAHKLNAGPWYGPSDARLKKDIEPYDQGLAALRRLVPVSYRFNGLGNTTDDGNVYQGLLAQEAIEVMPEMFFARPVKLHAEDAEDTVLYSLNPNALTYALINAVKELAVRIEALEGTPAPQPV